MKVNNFSRIRKYISPQKEDDITMLKIFKPIYMLLSILGLFPFSVNFKTKHSCIIVQRSIYLNSLGAVSINIFLIVFLVLHVRGIVLISEGSSLTDAIMTQINYIMELVNLLIVCIVAYYSAYRNRYNYVNILNTLASSWLELPVDGFEILSSLMSSVMYILAFLFFALCLQISVNFTRNDSLWKKILVTFSFNLPQMIQFIFLAFYLVLVLFVIALLAGIEKSLWSLKNKKYVPECFTKVTPRPQLRYLELVYIKAFEIKREINYAFQAPILITALQCFHSMVSEAHIIYHGVVIQRSLTTHEIINCSIWIVYQVLKMYALAYSGHLLKAEAFKLGQTLHKIPTENQDIRSLMEIQHFASLMPFQATEMTVYGYFVIDATLMFRITASATMYLIILVQFDKSDNK